MMAKRFSTSILIAPDVAAPISPKRGMRKISSRTFIAMYIEVFNRMSFVLPEAFNVILKTPNMALIK